MQKSCSFGGELEIILFQIHFPTKHAINIIFLFLKHNVEKYLILYHFQFYMFYSKNAVLGLLIWSKISYCEMEHCSYVHIYSPNKRKK